MDEYKEIKARYITGMTDLRINFHPNRSYALYVQPRHNHDIYRDSRWVLDPKETVFTVTGPYLSDVSVVHEVQDEMVLRIVKLPGEPGPWETRDPAFAVRLRIKWENGEVTEHLVWVGDNFELINLLSDGALRLRANGDKLYIRNDTSFTIEELEFLISVNYAATVIPCIFKQVTDMYNVQELYGPDAGELFSVMPDKVPYTVVSTTTYLMRAGIDPEHDDWLVIDGIRYVISRIRPINRNHKTGQTLPSVFSALVYMENFTDAILEEAQHLDFIQVNLAYQVESVLTFTVSSGKPITQYVYYTPEDHAWRPLNEGYFFSVTPTKADLSRQHILVGFKMKDESIIKKVISLI
jgi:hypothetical protein